MYTIKSFKFSRLTAALEDRDFTSSTVYW